jgi:23S rRNA pseudouridine2605 synthase
LNANIAADLAPSANADDMKPDPCFNPPLLPLLAFDPVALHKSGSMATERLQKILAHAGVASRRAAERLITEGHVRVNGRIVKELGAKADPHKDRVELDGKRLVAEHPVYYLLHKPREVVTTLSDPEQRESVADLTKRIPERVFPVGRLDYHTSGALLMTNDGEMAQALLHPRKRVPKVYVAKVRGVVTDAHLQQLRLGVTLDDGQKTGPAEVFIANEERGNMWLQITITEGKNRQVHRMLDAVGYRVTRLFRLSFAGLSADGLRTGEFRNLTDSELSKLKRDYLNPSKKDKADTKRDQRRARMAGELGLPAPAPGWEPARSLPRALRDRDDAQPAVLKRSAIARGPRAKATRGPVERGAGGAVVDARIRRGGHAGGGGKHEKRGAKQGPRRTRAAGELAAAPAKRWEPARSLPRALRDREDAKVPARQTFAGTRAAHPRGGATRGKGQRGQGEATLDPQAQGTSKAFGGKRRSAVVAFDPSAPPRPAKFGSGKQQIGGVADKRREAVVGVQTPRGGRIETATHRRGGPIKGRVGANRGGRGPQKGRRG